MLGVSYQLCGRCWATGIVPEKNKLERQNIWPKLGIVTMHSLPTLSISLISCSGLLTACSVSVMITRSKDWLSKSARPLSRSCSITLTPFSRQVCMLAASLSKPKPVACFFVFAKYSKSPSPQPRSKIRLFGLINCPTISRSTLIRGPCILLSC